MPKTGIVRISYYTFLMLNISELRYLWKTNLKKIEGCLPQVLLGPFLNTLSHLFEHGITVVYSTTIRGM